MDLRRVCSEFSNRVAEHNALIEHWEQFKKHIEDSSGKDNPWVVGKSEDPYVLDFGFFGKRFRVKFDIWKNADLGIIRYIALALDENGQVIGSETLCERGFDQVGSLLGDASDLQSYAGKIRDRESVEPLHLEALLEYLNKSRQTQ